MENLISILNIFSKNWLIIILAILTIPIIKLMINAYVQVKIAKLTNHQKMFVSIETDNYKKSIEISSSELKLNELNDQILNVDICKNLKVSEIKKIS